MRSLLIMAGSALIFGLAACESMPSNTTVAEYCADASKANEAVCQLKVEINGNTTALADTNMRLDQARTLAENAAGAADQAITAAAAAQDTADRALSLAQQDQGLNCKTMTIQKTDTGTCEPGYTLVGCTQTRYTTRAGGLSFLREVNDEKCRFNSRVLEMQVRCCASGAMETDANFASN